MPFTFPIGTPEERATVRSSDYNPNNRRVWFAGWVDATPHGTKYSLGYHTGADLNNNSPRWDADAHSPIYAIGDGVVTYGQLVSKDVWGNLIVIFHGTVDGKPVYSRYAHVEELAVSKGLQVKMGQQIARVGNQFGKFAYHLHFDISTTEQLKTFPTYWPGNDLKGVMHHFVDPQKWLFEHLDANATDVPSGTGQPVNPSPIKPPVPPTKTIWYVLAAQVDVYKKPASEKVGTINFGEEVVIDTNKGAMADEKVWAPITEGAQTGNWVPVRKSDQTESYLSTNKPAGFAPAGPTSAAVTDSTWYVVVPQLDIYKSPSTSSDKTGSLAKGSAVSIDLNNGKVGDEKLWGQITDGTQKGNWVTIRSTDQSKSYLTSNKPQ